ncbi:oxidoreductase [Rubellimicrobium rubrum]|uniref:Oxidoreductase n=2 Tax=Rubellimicrobium rubrum TaxID=2585369 RepID=A0A5C4MQ62_9RHOB|nr:oxidoreductase [Rubellimicrobium rubrum]
MSVAGLSGARAATAAPTLSGEVILTLSGQVGTPETGATTAFDLGMLDSLPQREIVTATPWHEGTPRFSGPTIDSVLEAAQARGAMLIIRALNDYASDMPVEDARTIPVILATRIDGKVISVRDKGPIFVIYPFDQQPELFNEVYFTRSVWQVTAIEVMG